MDKQKNNVIDELLKDQRVIDEIQRHLWIESEKQGHDIGFENAKIDWLAKFSKVWMAYNMPQSASVAQKKGKIKAEEKPRKIRKRRAKSYL